MMMVPSVSIISHWFQTMCTRDNFEILQTIHVCTLKESTALGDFCCKKSLQALSRQKAVQSMLPVVYGLSTISALPKRTFEAYDKTVFPTKLQLHKTPIKLSLLTPQKANYDLSDYTPKQGKFGKLKQTLFLSGAEQVFLQRIIYLLPLTASLTFCIMDLCSASVPVPVPDAPWPCPCPCLPIPPAPAQVGQYCGDVPISTSHYESTVKSTLLQYKLITFHSPAALTLRRVLSVHVPSVHVLSVNMRSQTDWLVTVTVNTGMLM